MIHFLNVKFSPCVHYCSTDSWKKYREGGMRIKFNSGLVKCEKFLTYHAADVAVWIFSFDVAICIFSA